MQNYSEAPNAGEIVTKGSATAPYWKAQLMAQYAVSRWSLDATEQFISAVKMVQNQVQGIHTNKQSCAAGVLHQHRYRQGRTDRVDEGAAILERQYLFNRDLPIDVIPPKTASRRAERDRGVVETMWRDEGFSYG
jgi:hypothetical protein